MIRPARFRALCSSLGDVEERPHFDRTAFRTPARTFATLGPSGEEVNVLLPLDVQQMLVDAQPAVFTRLSGGWGARGWTRMELARVDEVTCREVLREAYLLAQPKPKAKRSTAATKSKGDAAERKRAKPRSASGGTTTKMRKTRSSQKASAARRRHAR